MKIREAVNKIGAILLLIASFYQPGFGQLCTGSLGDAVINITFGSGVNPGQPVAAAVPGASTTYTYVPVFGNPATPVVIDGQYTITNNVVGHSPWYGGGLDHTPSDVNGYMAFFNASESPGEFYRQTITGLCENTRYEVACWVANVLRPNVLDGVKPDLTFRLERTNGTLITSFATGPISQRNSLTWEQRGFFFATPPGVISVVLKIVNTNVGGMAQPGNDFAIDDITFRPCGPTLQPSFNSTILQNNKTQCGFAAVDLFASTSAGYSSPSYLWQISLNNGSTWTDLPSSNSLSYSYTPTTAGVFNFRILSGEGSNITSGKCRVASNMLTLTINPPPQASIAGNTICAGEQAQIAFQITGGAQPYSATLTDGTSNFTLANLSATAVANITPSPATTTTYTLLTLTDNTGCKRTSGFTNSTTAINVTGPCVVVTPSFSIPDTVCVNTPVNIANTSTGASTYYWNFCVADLNSAPTGTNLGNVNGRLSSPVFMDYAYHNGNYYGFVINHSPGGLVRLDFGNSLLNTPTSVNLGNFGGTLPVATGSEGIQVVFNENRWYAIVVAGFPSGGISSRLVKIDFGPNLANPSPAVTNWGNIGNMQQPIDLFLFKENSSWYGFTVTPDNKSIIQFNFTNSFNNTPTAINLGNLGNLQYPTGIHAINDNGNWRVFIVNGGDNARVGTQSSLSRLDFGSSLLNTPTAVNLGNPGGMLRHPRDLTIMKSCDQVFGFVVNGSTSSNNIMKLDFGNNLAATPIVTSLGNVGNLDFPHSISKLFRVNENIYGFVPNVANSTITRLKFSGCTNANTPNSSLQHPPAVTYNSPGVYNINLTVDDGLPTQSATCNQVVVVAPPVHLPTRTVAICQKDSIKIGTTPGAASYLWSNGASTDSINVFATGLYVVETSTYGCVNRDSIVVTFKPKPALSIAPAANVCVNDSVQLSASGAATYQWLPVSGLSDPAVANPKALINSPIKYLVKGMASNGCTAIDSVIINPNSLPVVSSTADTALCGGGIVQLHASGALSYQWTPAADLSDDQIDNPLANVVSSSVYYVVGTDANGCSSTDSTKISIHSNPVIRLSNDTSACVGSTLVLQASGAQQYQWSPIAGLDNATSATPSLVIDSNIVYTVTGISAEGCRATRSVQLTALALPQLQVANDTAVCPANTISLFASGAQQYQWTPAAGLCDPRSSNPVAIIDSSIRYMVTGTGSNGCTSSKAISVTALALPLVQVTNDTMICGAGSIPLQASGAQNYQWFPATGLSSSNQASVIATVSGNTRYTVVGKSANGCEASDSVNISVLDVPVLTLPGDTTVCQNTPVQLVLSGAQQYSWSPSTGVVNPNTGNPTLTLNSTTKYSVTGTSMNGCSDTGSITISVAPKPVLQLTPDTSICAKGSVQLLASGAQHYQWQPASGLTNANIANPVAAPVSTTKYFITGTGSNGCYSLDSVMVHVKQPPVFAVAPVNGPVCSSSTVRLHASGGDTYLWQPAGSLSDPAVANPVARPQGSTVYSVLIRDSKCALDSTLTVVVDVAPAPVIKVLKENDITCSQPWAQLHVSGASTYRWMPESALSNAAVADPVARVNATTMFYVTGTSVDGCSSTDSVQVKFTGTGNIANIELPSAFTPNADGKNDCFGIRMFGNAVVEFFRIYNRWGEVVFSGNSTFDCWDGKLNGILQPQGTYVYFLKLKSTCGDVERKGTIVLLR